MGYNVNIMWQTACVVVNKITAWKKADLLALLCVVFSCVLVTFPYGFWARCGA